MKAGCSFSFLEVIVGCEIADTETTSGDEVVNIDSGQKKKIYLHLKKFFRGTRFTSIPFLKSIEGKHKVGEFVCVSGKVSLWFCVSLAVFLSLHCCMLLFVSDVAVLFVINS